MGVTFTAEEYARLGRNKAGNARLSPEEGKALFEPKKRGTAKEKPVKMPKASANSITTAAIDWLNLNGFEAWRNDSVGIWDPVKQVFRKNKKKRLGVPDILGFRKSDGCFLAIEVKAGADKLSPHQIEFLQVAKKAGVICGVIHSGIEIETIIKQHLTK